MKRRVVLVLLGTVLFWPSAAGASADPEGARQVVQDTTDRMLAILSAQREELRAKPERIYPLVDTIILPHFDFTRMSRWVLGKHWREATDAQKARFVEEFRNLLVRTYATALLEYAGQTVNVLPLRGTAAGATEVSVRTEVRQPGAPPIPIHYSMGAEGGAWKVFDVTIDGISLVASYRSNFSNEIARGGIDRLIALLEQRNRDVGRSDAKP
jgi:phospholipid transport system substrate-binding protein